jgi:hypothetical protein
MAMTPQDHVWVWLTKGFDGLFALISKWRQEGVPVTPRLKEELTKLRERLDALIKDL